MYLDQPEPPLRPDEVPDGTPRLRRALILSAVLGATFLLYWISRLAS